MLHYCFVPVSLQFEVAAPALMKAIDSGPRLLSLAERQAWRTLAEMRPGRDYRHDSAAFAHGAPILGKGQVTVPITCTSEDHSLLAMAGDLTLSRLGPTLCHLSLRTSSSGRWAPFLLQSRVFQMITEVAIAGFLDRLAEGLTDVASGRRTVLAANLDRASAPSGHDITSA
jgi:hypothetical protein